VSRVPRVAVALLCAAALAACSNSSPGASERIKAASATITVPITSTLSTGTDTWVVAAMGHLDQPINTFWQMFVTPGRTRRWALVTPPGVADNGGLVMTAPTPASLVAGFRPSQELAFSPLATSRHPGAWAVGGPVTGGGLADVPDALSVSSTGRAVALVLGGSGDSQVLAGNRELSQWTTITSLDALAADRALGSCDLTELTAVAATDAGDYVGGTCTAAGVAGIVRRVGGHLTLAGPASPGWVHDQVEVIRLTSDLGRLAALLRLTDGSRVSYAAAWTHPGSGAWSISPAVPRSGRLVSTGVTATGGFVVETAAAGAAPLAADVSPGARGWTALPALPAGTVAVAVSGSGSDAVVLGANTFADYQLSARDTWVRAEHFGVSIPYGSSG
jgi:hypothetical protein